MKWPTTFFNWLRLKTLPKEPVQEKEEEKKVPDLEVIPAKVIALPPPIQPYHNLYKSCVVDPKRLTAIDAVIEKLTDNKSRYESVAKKFPGMPWYFVAVIHQMEATRSFRHHLHNGDPLTARTTHVPAGRPKTGTPPFTWEQSAEDALKYQGFDKITDWQVSNILKQLENYNGTGYRKRGINTPYLWCGTNHYGKPPNTGKYVADGKFDPKFISTQIGCAAFIKRMADKGLL